MKKIKFKKTHKVIVKNMYLSFDLFSKRNDLSVRLIENILSLTSCFFVAKKQFLIDIIIKYFKTVV